MRRVGILVFIGKTSSVSPLPMILLKETFCDIKKIPSMFILCRIINMREWYYIIFNDISMDKFISASAPLNSAKNFAGDSFLF